MTFLLLAIQSLVCVLVVSTVKRLGIINCGSSDGRDLPTVKFLADRVVRDFDTADAKAWFPVSSLLVAVIYTGSKALQFLSIPVYT
jgi:GDP-mannose transporter